MTKLQQGIGYSVWIEDQPISVVALAAGGIAIDPWMLGSAGVHKFGQNTDIDTGDVPAPIWDGPKGGYTGWIAAAEACEVLSNDGDDAAGDTGARTVIVQGLDGSGNLQSFTATMAGATPVPIGSFYRIFRMRVITAGTTQTNEGTITARTVAGSTVMAVITPGTGQTLMAIYTTPADYDKAYMINLWLQMRHDGTNNRAGTFALLARAVGDAGANAAWQTKETMEVYNRAGPLFHPMYHASTYEPLTDLILIATDVTANNVIASGGFDMKFV